MSAAPSGDAATADALIAVEAAQGNAAVGWVLEPGSHATVLVGQRVLVGAVDACGECDVCRRGGAPVCPRARRRVMAEQIHASPRWLVPLAEPGEGGLQVPGPRAAAIAGEAGLAYTLYARTGIGAREPAVIVGTSAVARFLIEILIAKGIAPVVVCERGGAEAIAWREWVTARGAIAIVAVDDAADEATDDAVGDATDDALGDAASTRGAVAAAIAGQGIGSRPWRIFVTAPEATGLAAALVGPRASLTLIAPAPALPGALVAQEVTIIGVAGPHPDLMVEVAALVVKGDLDLAGGTTFEAGDRTRAVLVRYLASM